MSTNLENLTDEIVKSLSDYSDNIAKKIDKAVSKTTKEAVDSLKLASPRRNSDAKPRKYKSSGKSYPAGSYANAWSGKTISKSDGNSAKIVRNTAHWHLTYLLEHGHNIVKHGNKVGSARAIRHIEPIEEKAVADFEKRVEEILYES